MAAFCLPWRVHSGAKTNIVRNCGFGYNLHEEQGSKVMRRDIRVIATVTGAMALSGCAVAPPTGPTVMALPGQGKTFAAFQQDDYACRGWAQQQAGNPVPTPAATNAAVGSAITGTAVGAGLGAAIGAASGGTAAAGAAIGAGAGLLAGTVFGAGNAAGVTQAGLQQTYDIAYTQCMYGHGNSVQSPPPVYAGYGYPAYGGYPYAYPAYGYYGPSFAIGFGGGWGWGWGGGWHGGWGGWHGGGWGGGWHH
jgi:hypothetical protein